MCVTSITLRNAIKSQVTFLIRVITMSVRSVYVLLLHPGPPGGQACVQDGILTSYSTDKKKLDSVALAVRIRCVRGTRTLRLRYAYVAFAVRVRCVCGTHTLRWRYAYVALPVLVRTGTCACATHALRMRCACDVKFLFVSTVHGCRLCASGTPRIRDLDKSITSFDPGRLYYSSNVIRVSVASVSAEI